ncbi:hypothetical protein H2198_001620 [Neophaeococcomyces mojaviensis]|uniref:Uncharacterized protein n=1 Tax=Neophaeococcomyces mojaviensis TaxID=3383035 RepID=A0ACC3AGJ3_9EURO|nr:hypothetical protein H2198_001620 [Knufia sp. JES_112]
MASNYPDDIQFAGLVEAATAAADAHQRDLGKRKRGEENAYIPVSTEVAFTEQPRSSTLSSSAAVLFREPSEKSKKYSRPPLGKVFTSLELAPETFLRLQNAAKAYMLSDEHPERRDVVGHKKYSNNNDEAKLKLWQCVDDFLQLDSNGEKFFGHSSTTPEAPTRSFFWPEDHSRIVKLLMPLLRKMVTNERQRIYAAETRKQEPKVAEKKQKTQGDQEENNIPMLDEPVCFPPLGMAPPGYSGISPYPQLTHDQAPEIDPSLQTEPKPGLDENVPITSPDEPVNSGSIILRVNIVTSQDGIQKRITPELSLPAENAPTLDIFLAELKKHFEDMAQTVVVKTWLPHGLVPVKEDGEWVVSHLTAGMHEWMDGQLKVIVEV